MRLAFAIVVMATTPAIAQHDHGADDHAHHDSTASSYGAGVSILAASYDTMYYAGSYAGIAPSARWMRGRFGASASTAFYRLTSNGASYTGLGDVGLHAQAAVISRDVVDAGIMAGMSLPTGDSRHGLGMGHVMLMPAVYASVSVDRLRLGASVGYSRALGDSDHDHGAWPLVSPMLFSEISWNAAGDVRVSERVTAGARASGGVPADGDGGTARAIAAARVGYRAGRVDTNVELQAGLVGDPFTVRGVVSSTLTF